ncbi:MAG: hypothetical protein ACYDHX_05005 [Methanothrix sp.]
MRPKAGGWQLTLGCPSCCSDPGFPAIEAANSFGGAARWHPAHVRAHGRRRAAPRPKAANERAR